MIEKIIKEFSSNHQFYTNLLIEHLMIILVAIGTSISLGLFLGISISKKPKIAKYIIPLINILYTIPSIALLGFLISITGIGNTTAIITLTIYGLLPMVRSTYVGLSTIDPNIIEASYAMGSKEHEVLYKIKLPLAFPHIFTSIRNMVIMTVALAGIASFVGAGGLGVAIYRGITTNNHILIVIGSLMIASLALILDSFLGIFEKLVMKHKLKKFGYKKLASILIIFFTMISFTLISLKRDETTIKIASKPTSESYILAEIVGLLIENESDLKVDITHGVGGGTSNIHPAILKGDFHIYPEYTGTAWQIILKRKENYTDEKFSFLKNQYDKEFDLSWKAMFGFNNSYSFGIRKDLADELNIKTFSDLAKYSNDLNFGAEYDFFQREDGFNSVKDYYNLNFKKVVDMDNGLKYQALFSKKLDVMTVFTTDGQISHEGILVLEDDKQFYPRYMAGLVVRNDILKKYPQLNEILHTIENKISEKDMSTLNYKVEVEKENPRDVARKFLKDKGLWRKR